LLTKPNSALLDNQNSKKKSKPADKNTKKGKVRISGQDGEL